MKILIYRKDICKALKVDFGAFVTKNPQIRDGQIAQIL